MKKLLVLAILLASLQVFSQENVLNTVLRANKTDSTVVVKESTVESNAKFQDQYH
jgi:hypothetical protein